MPMMTELHRDGKEVLTWFNHSEEVPRWSWWHVGKIMDAMKEECPDEEVSITTAYNPQILTFGYIEHTFTMGHTFIVPELAIYADGVATKKVTFQIKKGDVYTSWRTVN